MATRYKLKRPRVGVTIPVNGGAASWLFISMSVFLSGGKPVKITTKNKRSSSKIDALIVSGGADIDTNITKRNQKFIKEYLNKTLDNETIGWGKRILSFFSLIAYPLVLLIRMVLSRKSTMSRSDKRRDEMEFSLIKKAYQENIPVLGICRGSQLINLYFKGDLHEDISSFYFEAPNPYSIFPVKTVHIKENSKLRNILGLETLKVNALHHQAIKNHGENLQVVAIEDNNVIQGIESTEADFIIGVQWHPEYLIFIKRHRNIFRELVKQAKVSVLKF